MIEPAIVLLFAAAVAAGGSVAMLRAWRRDRPTDSLLWWSVSLGLVAAGLALLVAGGDSPSAWPRMIGNYVTLAAAGAAYSGARRMNGMSPNLLMLVLGPTLWLALSAMIGDDFAGRVAAISALHGGYAFATAFEMVRRSAGRPAELRWAAAVMAIYGSLQLIRAVTGPNLRPDGTMDSSMNGPWVVPLAVVTTVYVATLATLIVRTLRKAGQLPDPERPTITGSRARQLP